MTGGREVHVVYGEDGAILAMAEAGDTEGPGGTRLTSTPATTTGQRSVRARLAEEHAALSLPELLERCELDHDQSPPILRARSAGR